MKITTSLFALTLASLLEFLSAYPVEYTSEGNRIEISRDGNSLVIPLDDPTKTGNYLENLFYFLAPEKTEDAASVIAEDWNMHVEREAEIAGVAVAPAKRGRPRLDLGGEEIEFDPESRETAIIESNELLPEPPAEIII